MRLKISGCKSTCWMFSSLLALALSLLANAALSLEPLKGRIEHRSRMPAVDKELLPGSVFSARASASRSNHWVKIPDWMAGTWLIREKTTVYRKYFPTGEEVREPLKFKAMQKFVYGMQKDRQGGIWHYAGVPYTSSIRMRRYIEYHIVKVKDFHRSDRQALSFTTIVTVVRASRTTSKIKRTYQQESITTYKPYDSAAGYLKLTGSSRSFSQAGKPMIQANNEALVLRTKQFEPVDSRDEMDLKSMFRQFLEETNRSELIPD